MGKKIRRARIPDYDTAQKNFEGYPDVFADIMNALVYEGETVVSPENLCLAETESFYKGMERRLRKQFEDLGCYELRESRRVVLYLLANQTKVEPRFLLRKESYVGGAYREQYEGKMQEACPVMEIILYWGKARWRGAKCLSQMFRDKALEPQAWKYIDDSKLHVFEMRHLSAEVRRRFQSDMRFVVEYLADEDGLAAMKQEVVHLEALMDLFEALSGDGRYQEFLDYLRKTDQLQDKREGGNWKMCKLMDKYWEGGRSQGIEQGIEQERVSAIRSLRESLRLTTEQAMKALNIPEEQFEHYAQLV